MRPALLLLILSLAPRPSHATVGFAEYGWSFHYNTATLLGWDHGDICDDAESKNCLTLPGISTHRGPLKAVNIPFLPGVDCLLFQELHESRWVVHRPSSAFDLYSGADFEAARSTWASCTSMPLVLVTPRHPNLFFFLTPYLVLLAALLFQLAPALRALTLSPLVLVANSLIGFSPLLVWLMLRWREALRGKERQRLKRAFLYVILFFASAFVPFLFQGPPSLFALILFPPGLMLNAGATLGVVWVFHWFRKNVRAR